MRSGSDKSKALQNALVAMTPDDSLASASARGRSSPGSTSARRPPARSPPAHKGVLERRPDDCSRSRSPQIPDRGPNTCSWCGGKACRSSGGQDGTLDQCEQHAKFHAQCCKPVPWRVLCQSYHSDKTSQDELDQSCAHFTDKGKLPEDNISQPTSVTKSDQADAEIYQKFSVMPKARLEAELREAGVIVSDKNITLATHNVPTAMLPMPGSATKQRYWIFPYTKGTDLPVLKLSSGCKLSHFKVLCEEGSAYSEHGLDSFKHTADTDMLEIDEAKLIQWDAFRYSLDVSRPPVEGKWEKARAAAASKRNASISSPASKIKAAKSVPVGKVPVFSPSDQPGTPSTASEPATALVDGDSAPGHKLPKAVREQDEDEAASDAETASGQEVVRVNRVRCDLWHAAIHGAEGNWRWQCERAAAHQRSLGNKDLANKLDEWCEYYKRVNWLAADKIMSATASEIESGLDVMYDQYDEVPAEIFPRLVAKRGAEVRIASKQGCYEPLINVTFPWCMMADDVPFSVPMPINAHMTNSLDDKLTIFRTVVFEDCLKDMILDKNKGTQNPFALCDTVHTKCQAVQNQRHYKPPPSELQAMSDVASACRFVMCLAKPDLLSDSIYIDAIKEACEFAKAQSAGKTCLSMVTYWVNSSVELKKSFQDVSSRLVALVETSKRIDTAKDELDDVTIDPNSEITLDCVADYSKAICKALKAVAYSQGAQVAMISQAFSETLPDHTLTLFEACKSLLKANKHSPNQVMEHIVKVVSEVSVVLPLNARISGLECDLASLQRNNDMNSRRHEWASATKALTTEVTLENLGQVDTAVKKFEGANFCDDSDLRAGAVAALQSFHVHCIEMYPLEPLRKDILGFTKDIQQFIAKDIAADSECIAATSLAEFLVAGCEAQRLMYDLKQLPLPEKLTLLDAAHNAGQQAVLACKHALKQLSDLLTETSDKLVSAVATDTILAANMPELFARTKDLIKDGEKAVKKQLEYLETVALESLEASTAIVESVQYGLPVGKSYLEGMPTGKTWNKWKSHVESTLGQSDVAAGMDEQLKASEQVCLIGGPLGLGFGSLGALGPLGLGRKFQGA